MGPPQELAGNGVEGTKVIRIHMTWCWGDRGIRSHVTDPGKTSCMQGMADAGLTESPHGMLPTLDLFWRVRKCIRRL